jgi:hypothetical protein
MSYALGNLTIDLNCIPQKEICNKLLIRSLILWPINIKYWLKKNLIFYLLKDKYKTNYKNCAWCHCFWWNSVFYCTQKSIFLIDKAVKIYLEKEFDVIYWHKKACLDLKQMFIFKKIARTLKMMCPLMSINHGLKDCLDHTKNGVIIF